MFKNKEYILSIYREGGFTKAAEKLFVSQPSLSASVKRIEEKVSAPIFDRSTSPVSLTEVGVEYVKCALEIEQKEKDFASYVSDHQNLVSGTIKIGGSSFFSSLILPKLISDFNKRHPKIQFEISEDSTKNLTEKLNQGMLDIIIDNAVINDENVISELYCRENLLLAVPARFLINNKFTSEQLTASDIKNDLHLTNCPTVPLSAFSGLPFILLNTENDTGKRAEKLLKKYQVKHSVLFHLDQQVTSYNVCCTGMGLTFVSDTLIKKIATLSKVYYYKIYDPLAVRNVYFYQKKNHYLSLACKKFIEYNTLPN